MYAKYYRLPIPLKHLTDSEISAWSVNVAVLSINLPKADTVEYF